MLTRYVHTNSLGAGYDYNSAKKSLTEHGEASKRVDLQDEWLIYIS